MNPIPTNRTRGGCADEDVPNRAGPQEPGWADRAAAEPDADEPGGDDAAEKAGESDSAGDPS